MWLQKGRWRFLNGPLGFLCKFGRFSTHPHPRHYDSFSQRSVAREARPWPHPTKAYDVIYGATLSVYVCIQENEPRICSFNIACCVVLCCVGYDRWEYSSFASQATSLAGGKQRRHKRRFWQERHFCRSRKRKGNHHNDDHETERVRMQHFLRMYSM